MPNEVRNLELSVDEINIILNALAQMPYSSVVALIPKIMQQANPPVPETPKPDLKEVRK